MRLLVRALLLLLVAMPLLAIVAIAMSLQDQPLVTGVARLTPQDIDRAKRVVRAQDPRRAGPDGLQTVVIGERDLGLALNYLAGRHVHGAARIELRPGAAVLQASIELPRNPVGRYLNIDAALRGGEAVPSVQHLRIGSLPVPAPLARSLLREGLRRLTATERGQLAALALRSASFGDGKMTVTYQWSAEVAALARNALVAPDHRDRLRFYQDELAAVAAQAPGTISLAALMPSLFRLAVERGAAGDPVRENRAAILVLAMYAVGRPIEQIVPVAAAWPRPVQRTVTLAGRTDFPRHFLVSAAIAAEAGSPLADAIGVYKEIEDSRGGSGFSFNDVGANRAGTRFGEVAAASPERARRLAQAVASGVKEADFMPNVSDLPEFLSEAEFKRRFGGVDGEGYAAMMAVIEQRVAALPLLRD